MRSVTKLDLEIIIILYRQRRTGGDNEPTTIVSSGRGLVRQARLRPDFTPELQCEVGSERF